MKLPLLIAAVLVVAPASAQTDPQTTPTTDPARADAPPTADDYRTLYQSDLDRLGQDLDEYGRSVDASARADYEALVESYDRLRTDFGSSDAAMSDPEAAQRLRQEYGQRYGELAGTVYRSRLSAAPNRDAYLRTAGQRLDQYDASVADLRGRYEQATGDERAMVARDLISLRGQRDRYQRELGSVRGTTRGGFDDAARQQATDRLGRADAEFQSSRRDALARPTGGAGPMDGRPSGSGM